MGLQRGLATLGCDMKKRDEAKYDEEVIDAFATAMKAKMALKRAQGRGGWSNKGNCSVTGAELSEQLRDHVEKDDPIDVANYCFMLWARGELITPYYMPIELPDLM